jgi:pimeloyl-ACP methyl ester carboxylesterase
MNTVMLQHNKITLALHEVRPGTGRPLLFLHGLGESAAMMSTLSVNWAGPVWALDFTGHGESSVPAGGGYSSEILMADADIALRHIGEATVLSLAHDQHWCAARYCLMAQDLLAVQFMQHQIPKSHLAEIEQE